MVIQLRELTSVTREDLKPYCISLVTPAKTHYLALKSDEELYSWMDDVYSRSPLMGVSNPTNFVHQVHVGFDPISGAFTGLPEQWTRLLTSSAITKEDYAKNPQAVLDVLEFYTDIQKRDAERDNYAGLSSREHNNNHNGTSSNGNLVGRSNGNTPPARFGAGTGLAGQRSDSLSSTNNNSRLAPPSSSNNNQIGFRQAPGPPPPASSRQAPPRPPPSTSNSSSSRPNLVPGRVAPSVPSSSLTRNDSATVGSSGLRPLLTSSLSRTNVPLASPTASSKPIATSLRTLDLNSSSTTATATTAGQQQQQSQPPPLLKSVPSLKKTPEPGERRISGMSEAQIMTKLRSVCSPQDPNTLYSKIKKVGQGASGSVYVAKVLATGSKVAIKQMDLSHQPRKELIVNEILVMKESQHPNIVNFLDSFLVKGAELWVVMEFMEGGALTDVIDSNSLEEDQISSISNEVRFYSLLCARS